MKVKVIIPFRDKETKKKYKKGDIIDVTAKRYNEIVTKARFVELIRETNEV